MPYRLDALDVVIINSLMGDGRLSYRQLAKMAYVSTPTVESRVRKLMDSGVIKKIAPIIDLGRIEGEIGAIVSLRVDSRSLNEVAKVLSESDEIRSIFVTTGESNLIVRLVVKDVNELQNFLDTKMASLKSVRITSSQIITRSIKDEQGVVIKPELMVRMNCDYCGSNISGRPYRLSVGEGERFFCCKTCQSSYKEKYASRIESVSTG